MTQFLEVRLGEKRAHGFLYHGKKFKYFREPCSLAAKEEPFLVEWLPIPLKTEEGGK